MPIWILITALLSVAVTALLASVLARINPTPRRDKASDGGGSGEAAPGHSGRSGHDHDGTGGDGGGDGGGD